MRRKFSTRLWSLLLLLVVTLMPTTAWAATHYDAGYVSASATYGPYGVKIVIDDIRLHNYQGNNSHWYGAPTVTLNVNGVAATFTFANLVNYSDDGNKNFYCSGEGNEDPYKNGFTSSTYTTTINGCTVKAYFDGKKYNQTIGSLQHWCTADLIIGL